MKQFPYYMNFAANEANLIVYTISIDNQHESATRPLAEYLNPLKAIVEKARNAWMESMVDEAQMSARIAEGLKPKEMILITCGETYFSHSTDKIEYIQSFAEANRIELCKEFAIPDAENEGIDASKRQEEVAQQVKKDILSILL